MGKEVSSSLAGRRAGAEVILNAKGLIPMVFHTPTRVQAFSDKVVLHVPSLHHLLRPLLDKALKDGCGQQKAEWRFCAWEENRHFVSLTVEHGSYEFAVLLPPAMWEHLADMQKSQVIMIVTQDGYVNDDGSVTSITLDHRGRLRQTAYTIPLGGGELGCLVEALKQTRQNWNPNGVLTYLLHILGEPLEASV